MEALKTKGIAHNGVLAVSVPKEFEEKELEVIILATHKNSVVDNQEKIHQEKVKRLLSIIGTAKHPDFPINKYHVYEQ